MEDTVLIYNKKKTKAIRVSKYIDLEMNNRLKQVVNKLDGTIERRQREMNKHMKYLYEVLDDYKKQIKYSETENNKIMIKNKNLKNKLFLKENSLLLGIILGIIITIIIYLIIFI